MKKILRNKRILISAGPVWVPIDKVRIMTNIFGGKLGYFIAKEAAKLGGEVTLLMGPGRVTFNDTENFKVRYFKYFEDIYKILKTELKTKKYDIVIHSAAIPDYIPLKTFNGKIKSGQKNFTIKFKTTPKIIDRFRKWDKDVFIVKFKLEVDKTKSQLIDIAYKSMVHSNADMIVANELNNIGQNHTAYVIDKNKKVITVHKKNIIAEKLMETIAKNLSLKNGK